MTMSREFTGGRCHRFLFNFPSFFLSDEDFSKQ
jgi:hypothetical protein